MKQLCDITKNVIGKYSKPGRPVKNKESKPITEIEERWNMWAKHIEEQSNGQATLNPLDIEAAHIDHHLDVAA
ncbi:unnamed protein product [Schistosoma curassoni]|uniref:HTH CENPB-type domain-containing protein n=1 Tax=Schistosoma curassoni TaxID=6186 RepID=A0A183KUP9_9TREM|nr:unnamed protein product [Schistosoma curassoni]